MWFVVQDTKDYSLHIQHSISRDMYLEWCALNMVAIPSIVLREFTTIEQAGEYLVQMTYVNNLIENL